MHTCGSIPAYTQGAVSYCLSAGYSGVPGTVPRSVPHAGCAGLHLVPSQGRSRFVDPEGGQPVCVCPSYWPMAESALCRVGPLAVPARPSGSAGRAALSVTHTRRADLFAVRWTRRSAPRCQPVAALRCARASPCSLHHPSANVRGMPVAPSPPPYRSAQDGPATAGSSGVRRSAPQPHRQGSRL